jgi:hypothetical protein
MSPEAAPDALPADIQSALLRGDRVEAIRLLRQRLQDPGDQSLPAVAAAFAREDHAEATRLLREALERSFGKPMNNNGPAEKASFSSGEQLAPGEVPPSRVQDVGWWLLAALVVVAALVYRHLAG